MHAFQLNASNPYKTTPPLLRRLGARRRQEDGQAMVEFTLILVPVMLLILGVAYFGIALNNWIDETHLASAAARFLAVDQGASGGTCKGGAKTTECVTPWLEHGDSKRVATNATITACSPGSLVGEYVEVKITYPQEWLPGFHVGASTQITSTARMRIEVPPEEKYPTGC